jgi:SagB-type dehydrogenase family enzyme
VLKRLLTVTTGATILVAGCASAVASPTAGEAVLLPSPRTDGARSLEDVLASRRSVRAFRDEPIAAIDVAQLLWAAQGVTDAEGGRTAPSAGALYPLELYVVDGAGASRYLPAEHALVSVAEGDLRHALGEAAGQDAVLGAPAVFVLAGVEARTAARYGDRAERYVQLEAGHAAQNLLLQATALGLGAVPIGAFEDAAVARALGLADGERPLYLIPVGHPDPPLRP